MPIRVTLIELGAKSQKRDGYPNKDSDIQFSAVALLEDEMVSGLEIEPVSYSHAQYTRRSTVPIKEYHPRQMVQSYNCLVVVTVEPI